MFGGYQPGYSDRQEYVGDVYVAKFGHVVVSGDELIWHDCIIIQGLTPIREQLRPLMPLDHTGKM